MQKRVPIIGICNGFQILTECKLLEGALIKNSSQLFSCKKVFLRIENKKIILLKILKRRLYNIQLHTHKVNFMWMITT